MEEISEAKKSILTEGVALAAIPVIAYYCAYQYEVGYFRVFSAPEDLISVDIMTLILFASVFLGMGIIFLYNFLEPLRFVRPDKLLAMPRKHALLGLVLLFFSLWNFSAVLHQFRWLSALVFPVIVVGQLLFAIALEWSNRSEMKDQKKSYPSYPQWLLVGSLLYTFSTFLCQDIGQHSAETQKRFTIIKGTENTLVIRKVGDHLLCATYDSTSHTFSRSTRLIPMDKELNLEYRDIGPLHRSP